MREEGSPAPVIDDIIGGLMPNFWFEICELWEGLGTRLIRRHPPIIVAGTRCFVS